MHYGVMLKMDNLNEQTPSKQFIRLMKSGEKNLSIISEAGTLAAESVKRKLQHIKDRCDTENVTLVEIDKTILNKELLEIDIKLKDEIRLSKLVDEVSFVSSHIISGGYDSQRSLLYLKFNERAKSVVYKYHSVPARIWDLLLKASSQGRFANQYICHEFKYERLSEKDIPFKQQ